MGYVTVTGICYGCKKPFSFHPNKVPSIRINGVREPICKDCVDRVNPLRKKKGLPPITYCADAYSVGQDENEINWGD
jgi:hypothetical protein